MNRRQFIKSVAVGIGAATVPIAARSTVIRADNSVTRLIIHADGFMTWPLDGISISADGQVRTIPTSPDP